MPVPQGNEVLVRVHATTVNRTDCGYRAAKPFILRALTGPTKPRKTIGGTEFAGVVESAGSSVRLFAPGEGVYGYVEGRFGAHAEYVTVPENAWIARIPDNIAFEEAAASIEGAHYAFSAIRAGKGRTGQDV